MAEDITIGIDPVLDETGWLVAGQFGREGAIIRQGYEKHPRVVRWLQRHRIAHYRVEPHWYFDELVIEALKRGAK